MIDNKVNLRLESINVLYYIIHNINKKNHQYKYKDNQIMYIEVHTMKQGYKYEDRQYNRLQ